MKLWQTRLHWEKFADKDPFWAVLTDPDKAGNRWQKDEFFATGQRDVAAAIAAVRNVHPAWRCRRALDFGCGVGRLTQALATEFGHVTGVDISSRMLELARQHNRHGERVRYVHNTRADLAGFADGSFDFVFSLITLQHMAPGYARGYIREFVRVLAPDGIALFQMPAQELASRRMTFWPPSIARRLLRSLRRALALEVWMEMHALPREDVLAIVRAAGAEVLAVDRSDAAGDSIESYRYMVRKRPAEVRAQ